MRTSVTLDEDVYSLASLYASARRITLGKAIGELIRKGEKAAAAPVEVHRSRSGLAMFAPRGGVVTPELIKRIENEGV